MSPQGSNTRGVILGRAKRLFEKNPNGIDVVLYLDQEVEKGRITDAESDDLYFQAEREIWGANITSPSNYKMSQSRAKKKRRVRKSRKR